MEATLGIPVREALILTSALRRPTAPALVVHLVAPILRFRYISRTTTEIDDALSRASVPLGRSMCSSRYSSASNPSRYLHLFGSQDACPAIDLGGGLTHTLASSRRELALSPTCQPRQGGLHEGGMRPMNRQMLQKRQPSQNSWRKRND